MSTPASPVRPALSESLKEQIELSRTRMLVGHMPRATLTVGGFAFVVIAMVCVVLPHPMNLAMSLWLFSAVMVSLLRTAHAIAYLRSQRRQAAHWRPTFLAMTLALGLVWAILPWVLPIEHRSDLTSSVVGSMIGMAATGASMLGFDRLHTRAWITPVLLSAVGYCVYIGGALGWFGMVSVAGFLVMLWLEADRAHRRMGEMLRLRYESEQLAQARAQALQEAESLSEAKSRFLATMSHEMRTPLHGILGLSRMLREELQSTTAHAQMSLLQNAGEHLLGVINDVLDFTRLKENKLTLNPRPLDLQSLVQGVCDLADATARDKGVVVTMASSLPPDLRVEADGDRLRQILTNLVGNAVKFTDHGHVVVRMSVKAEGTHEHEHVQVAFEVEDTGHGIAADQLSRIFDAFHQVEQGRDRLGGGTGLGLSIAQQICTAMGGRIHCDSRPHIGSVFSFVLNLPRAEAQGLDGGLLDGPLHSPHHDEAPPLSGTVLMAEDNPVNALVAQAMLEQLGLEVHVVDNGRLALEWLAHRQADVILMDCHMPEMGGLETTRLIREMESAQGLPATPIIAVSAGKTHSDDHRQCLAAGMNDYLSKPFHRDDLLRVLRRPMAQRVGAPAGCTSLPTSPPQSGPIDDEKGEAVGQSTHDVERETLPPRQPSVCTH